MAKRVKAVVKLQIPAGKANPAPPIGTALGPQGVNIMAFCKEYNERTANQVGMVIPAAMEASRIPRRVSMVFSLVRFSVLFLRLGTE